MGAYSRSTVGTTTDASAILRAVFSRIGEPRLAPSSMLSFNDPSGMCPTCEGIGRVSALDGAWPECKGLGLIYTDLGMMAGVATTCEACEGRRFTDDVLVRRYHAKDIAEVYDLPIDDALAFFRDARMRRVVTILQRLVAVGPGYIRLGQPLSTLSGGEERQRLKLAVHMAGKQSVYVLDEAISGLHLADVEHLLALLDRLVDDGGEVVFEGTPADLVADLTRR